jgi:hypothetical protein
VLGKKYTRWAGKAQLFSWKLRRGSVAHEQPEEGDRGKGRAAGVLFVDPELRATDQNNTSRINCFSFRFIGRTIF